MTPLDRKLYTRFLGGTGDFQFRRLDSDPEVARRERVVREKEMILRPEIQDLLRIASFGFPQGRAWALEQLDAAIDAETLDSIRNLDSFRPYGTPDMLNEGNLHLLNQVDGMKWSLDPDALLRGGIIIGPQGVGKTRLLVHIAEQLRQMGRHFFISDPKGELAAYAAELDSAVFDDSDLSLDCSPPDGEDRRTYLHELMPQVGGIPNLIQGISLLYESGDIALPQLDIARRLSAQPYEICLRDIRQALSMVEDAGDYRRAGYLQGADTALQRIERGSGNLFVCRKGAPLSQLLRERNVILRFTKITDSWACRLLILIILYFLYKEARHRPPTTQLELLIILDDAQRFISRELGATLTSPLTHILAVLRSSGVGVLAITHVPSQIDPGVLALANLVLVVGGVHGPDDREVVSKLLALRRDQQRQIGRMRQREVIGYYAGGRWRYPVHGWTPDVADPQGDVRLAEEEGRAFVESLGIIPWKSLWEYREAPAPRPEPATQPVGMQVPPASEALPDSSGAKGLQAGAYRLLVDAVAYPYDPYTTRLKRLGLSGREGQSSRDGLEQDALARHLAVGQAVHLFATPKGYAFVNQTPPAFYRGDSVDHNFLRALARHLLLQESSVDRVEMEVPVDDKGSTVDLVVHRKNGDIEAWEVSISAGNVTGNAIKCGAEGFRRVVFLCRDCAVRQAVSKRVERSGLPPDLRHRVRYVLFSNLTRRSPKP